MSPSGSPRTSRAASRPEPRTRAADVRDARRAAFDDVVRGRRDRRPRDVHAATGDPRRDRRRNGRGRHQEDLRLERVRGASIHGGQVGPVAQGPAHKVHGILPRADDRRQSRNIERAHRAGQRIEQTRAGGVGMAVPGQEPAASDHPGPSAEGREGARLATRWYDQGPGRAAEPGASGGDFVDDRVLPGEESLRCGRGRSGQEHGEAKQPRGS